jgi:hypothetical protein
LKEGKGIKWIAKDLNVGDRKVSQIRRKMLAEGLLKLNMSSSVKNDASPRRRVVFAKQTG